MSSGCGHEEHGEIVAVHLETFFELLIVGFANGRVHIIKCPGGVVSNLNSRQEERCISLEQDLPCLHAMHCLYKPPSPLEIWCGTESDRLELWCFPPSPDGVSDPYRLEREITILSLSNNSQQKATVRQMRLNYDLTHMVVLLKSSQVECNEITFVDIRSRMLLKSVQCYPGEPHMDI